MWMPHFITSCEHLTWFPGKLLSPGPPLWGEGGHMQVGSDGAPLSTMESRQGLGWGCRRSPPVLSGFLMLPIGLPPVPCSFGCLHGHLLCLLLHPPLLLAVERTQRSHHWM